MAESKLEGEVLVKDLDLFLERSKQGANLVYQLHRELGAVFIDASFADKENPSLLYKMKIFLDPPKLAHSTFEWDEHGFPYELETYQATDGSEVTVPLYRSEHGESMNKFLEDIAEYELQPDGDKFEDAPKEIKVGIDKMLAEIEALSKVLEESGARLSDRERGAVDVYFGQAGIFDLLGDSADEAVAKYLRGIFWENGQLYAGVQKAAQEERQRTLVEVENKAIETLENTLKTHNFKQGFVSTEVVVT